MSDYGGPLACREIIVTPYTIALSLWLGVQTTAIKTWVMGKKTGDRQPWPSYNVQ